MYMHLMMHPMYLSYLCYIHIYRIWYNMLGEKLVIAPELEVSIFEGKLYVILYWKPQTPLHSMLRPQEWHTRTLTCLLAR